jgi:hypothetical protein
MNILGVSGRQFRSAIEEDERQPDLAGLHLCRDGALAAARRDD